METLEPGAVHSCQVGNKTVDVLALSFRKKQAALQQLEQCSPDSKAKPSEKFAAMEQAFKIVTPEHTHDELDRLDEREVMQVINFALIGSRLSEDERKKSE